MTTRRTVPAPAPPAADYHAPQVEAFAAGPADVVSALTLTDADVG